MLSMLMSPAAPLPPVKFLSTSAVYPGSVSDDLRWLLKGNLFVTGASFLFLLEMTHGGSTCSSECFWGCSCSHGGMWHHRLHGLGGDGWWDALFSHSSRYLLNPRPLYRSPASPATQKIAVLHPEPGRSGHEPREDHSQLLLSPVISPRWLLPLVAFPLRDIWHCRHQRDFSGDSCGVRMALN